MHIYLNKGAPLKCHKGINLTTFLLIVFNIQLSFLVVLVARSPVFAKILSELPESEDPDKPTELKVNWDNPSSFKNLIRYLYNDMVDTKALKVYFQPLT